MDAAAYARQLFALLPPGAAWSPDSDSGLRQLLLGLAEEFARVDRRAWDLLREADPDTTFELLPAWERVYGLPDGCTDTTAAIAQRRAAVVARVVSRGGQTPAYFVGVAAAMGFTVTVTEFSPFDVDDSCDALLCGDAWAHAWQVNAPASTVGEFSVDDPVNESLAWWGNAILECVLSRLKPAQTYLQFSYT